MKRVVTIEELGNLIPEIKKLGMTNFKDMKHLLSSVIDIIEKTGSWEFVQYVNMSGSPSLFIVKEKEITAVQYVPHYDDAYSEIMSHYDQANVRNNDIESRKNTSEKIKNSKPSEKEKKSDPIYKSMEDFGTSLFPASNMPWQKL